MSVNLYYTQGIRGFQQEKVEYSNKTIIFTLKRIKFQCSKCGSTDLTITSLGQRAIKGAPYGKCTEVIFQLETHRLYCHNCQQRKVEYLPFISHPKSRINKALERTILELRPHMSIRALSDYLKVRWHVIKDLEKQFLEKKYSKINLSKVKSIGLDEIYVSKTSNSIKYLTVVRDLDTGAVLHVGDSKGVVALEGFLKKLKKSKLKVVTMDMSNAYSSWFLKHFPKLDIVFDHFHVIKLMNDKLDSIRRKVVAKLDETQQSQFKNLRFIFLKNNENLNEDAKLILQNIRIHFKDLSDAYLLKESLRSIYKNAKTSYHANIAFLRWCKLAEETGISELRPWQKQ